MQRVGGECGGREGQGWDGQGGRASIRMAEEAVAAWLAGMGSCAGVLQHGWRGSVRAVRAGEGRAGGAGRALGGREAVGYSGEVLGEETKASR